MQTKLLIQNCLGYRAFVQLTHVFRFCCTTEFDRH